MISNIFCLCTPVNMEMNDYNHTKQWANLMLKLTAEVFPGMPHVHKTIHGENKTFSTILITVNFQQIDFAVNLLTVAYYDSKIHNLCVVIVTSVSPNYRVSEHQNCLRTTDYCSTDVALSFASIRNALSSRTPAVCIQK